MSKKHITAPLSYDPGKGRPKEYLAYLNWQEMQALQRLNGGNMERGPRGLPSFPPDDAIGSNQTPGSGNWTGSPGGASVGSGPGGDVGGTTESGNIGGAGTSTSTTSSAASSAASTTSAASQNTTDEAAQQATAVNNAVEAAKNAALSEDARRAGIGSIEVGPMRAPVTIGGGQVFGSLSRVASETYGAQAGIPSPDSLAGRTIGNVLSTPYNTVFQEMSPVTGRIQDVPGEFRSGGRRLHSGVDVAVEEGAPVTPRVPGTVIQVATRSKGYGPTVQVLGVDGTVDRYALHKPQQIDLKPGDPVYQDTVIGLAGAMPVKNGFSHLHYEGITRKDPAYSKIIDAMNAGTLAKTTGPIVGSTSNPILGSVSAARAAPKTSTSDILSRLGLSTGDVVAGGVSPISPTSSYADATPAAENLIEKETAYNPSVMSDPLAMATMAGLAQLPSVLSNFSIPSIPEASFADKMKIAAGRVGLSPEKFQEEVNKRVSEAVQNSGFSLSGAISSGISALNKYAPSETVVATPDDSVVPQAPDYLPPDKARPKFVSPETVQIMEDQERKNRTGIKLMEKVPGAGGIAGLIERGQKLFTGKDIADYGTDLKREYLQADEDQKAAMRDKYPDIRRFAVSIGEIAPNTGIQNASAGIPTRELGGKNYEQQYASYSSPYQTPYGSRESFQPTATDNALSLREQYLLWDKGIGIPEPGDPDYNDYMKYLKSRGTSAQV